MRCLHGVWAVFDDPNPGLKIPALVGSMVAGADSGPFGLVGAQNLTQRAIRRIGAMDSRSSFVDSSGKTSAQIRVV